MFDYSIYYYKGFTFSSVVNVIIFSLEISTSTYPNVGNASTLAF